MSRYTASDRPIAAYGMISASRVSVMPISVNMLDWAMK